MEVELIFKIAGIGLLVAFLSTVLEQMGKKEYSQWITLAGFLYILFSVAGVVNQLFDKIKSVFLFTS